LAVGYGPDDERFRKQARDLQCEHVIFAGHIRDTAKLAALYSAADVFVFPSLGDPYGVVVDEAMACRLPIIASSSVGEIGERVHEGENGFVVPPRDSLALADRMERFIANPDMTGRMGTMSRYLINSRTLEQWATEFESAIVRIARSAPVGG
jgi:glycosyltransferase involved in cell wall biosynthesis